MNRGLLPLIVLLFAAGMRSSAQDGLLFHYSCNEGQGSVLHDSSSNGLNGACAVQWAESPSGKALSFDGQPSDFIKVNIPKDLRLGKGSWTFGVWLKPTLFTINDSQNQRRIFSYGAFPDANLVIDILSNGQLSYYFCYRNKLGNIVAAGGSSAGNLALNQWACAAVVCDRKLRQVTIYINGFNQGSTKLPTDFDGDYQLDGGLTLGSGWHNYEGYMDEVRLYRRALTRAEIKTEYSHFTTIFGVKEAPENAAAERREELMTSLNQVQGAWSAGNYQAVRSLCQPIVASTAASAALRSYAHLRVAQSYAAQKDWKSAISEYGKIASTATYPDVYRSEAKERVSELTRIQKGEPARDPAGSRAKISSISKYAAQIFVSPTGNDQHGGTARSTVASLTRARDLVREQIAKGITGPVAVNILPGIYRVSKPLELSRQDSGTNKCPIVYRSVQPGKAVFYGGKRLSGFRPVSDPAILARLPRESADKVVCCDLHAQGINDYGELAVRGFGQPPSPPTLELFVNGMPMTLARWPNTGFVGIGKLIEPGSKSDGKPSVFEYLDDRHARWTQANDAWLFGYFRYLWADATIKIANIDPAKRTVTTAEAYEYGGPGMDAGQGIQYYAFNLLEEIDEPGEWYLDRGNGMLYLYPPTDLRNATVEIGMLSTPTVAMDRVSNVHLEGIVFDLARFNGLTLTDCDHCLIAGCTVSRMAGNGVTISGGEADGLLGCDIHTIGRRGTEVIGGNRETLKPGKHFVENCVIHDFGRIDRTCTPAIQLEGVGNRVAHNLMYNCPSSVMRIEGNDHLIEYNDVYNAVLESDDQGAMEMFGNPSYRGVVFRHNRFTNCGRSGGGAEVCGQAAIRLDDVISGILIYGNVFVNSANGGFGAIQINSGRDNVFDNNLFVDCKQGISGGWYPGNGVWRQLERKEPTPNIIVSPLYLKRYPEMANMLSDPGINHVWRNVFYRCGSITTGNSAYLDMMENGDYADKNSGSMNATNGNSPLFPNAASDAAIGFNPIPMDEIGPYKGGFRASWPVAKVPASSPTWRKK